MGASNAAGMFGQFIEGYTKGQQQAKMANIQKAQGLMQLAQMHAKAIDEASGENAPQIRAAYHDSMMKALGEADKLMNKKVGLQSLISKVFKPQNAQAVDPHQVLSSAGLAPTGMTGDTKNMPVGPQSPPPQENADGVPVDWNSYNSAVSGIAGQGVPQEAIPTSPPQPPPEVGPRMADVPNSPATGEYVQNRIQAFTDARRASTPEVLEANPAPMTQTASIPEPQLSQFRGASVPVMSMQQPKTAPGTVAPEKSTGKGLEVVDLGNGLTDYRLNGQRISLGDYRELSRSIGLKRFENDLNRENQESNLDYQTKLERRKRDLDTEYSRKAAEAYINDGGNDPDIINELKYGIKPSTPKLDDYVTPRDNKTGKRFKQVIDTRTGKPIANIQPQEVPWSAEESKIAEYLPQAGSWDAAEKMYYASVLKDRTLQNRVKELQAQNTEQAIAAKKQLNEIRAKKDKGGLTRNDILKARANLRGPIIQSLTSMTLPDGTVVTGQPLDLSKYNALMHQQLEDELGMPMSEINKVYGGDVIADIKDSHQNEADNIAKQISSGRGASSGPANAQLPPPPAQGSSIGKPPDIK